MNSLEDCSGVSAHRLVSRWKQRSGIVSRLRHIYQLDKGKTFVETTTVRVSVTWYERLNPLYDF